MSPGVQILGEEGLVSKVMSIARSLEAQRRGSSHAKGRRISLYIILAHNEISILGHGSSLNAGSV